MSAIRTLREEELQADVFEESGPVVLDFYDVIREEDLTRAFERAVERGRGTVP